jgi:hypothetical protein
MLSLGRESWDDPRTVSAFNRSPSEVLMVLTLPSRFVYCVSKWSLLSVVSSNSLCRFPISSSCFSCMLSKLFLSCVTSCRSASRSLAMASRRAFVSEGGGGDGESPCCERDRERPNATAEDMECDLVPFAWAVVGESGCSSSSTSSGSVACAAGC